MAEKPVPKIPKRINPQLTVRNTDTLPGTAPKKGFVKSPAKVPAVLPYPSVPPQTEDEGTPEETAAYRLGQQQLQGYVESQYAKRDAEGYPFSARPMSNDGTGRGWSQAGFTPLGAEAQAFANLDARRKAIGERFSQEGITLRSKQKKG